MKIFVQLLMYDSVFDCLLFPIQAQVPLVVMGLKYVKMGLVVVSITTTISLAVADEYFGTPSLLIQTYTQ